MLFPDSNLSSFWQIFFKLCVHIDIREEWFGIANGLNSFINTRVMALDWCKMCFYTLPHKKWRGIMLFPPNFECLSIRRLSVSASFPCSDLSTFWTIFFKLGIDIGIGEEWYEIASGLISLWNKSYGPWCMLKMLCFSLLCSNFSTFLPIFFNFA